MGYPSITLRGGRSSGEGLPVPASKTLKILASAAWVTTAITAALELAGHVPLTLFLIAAVCAVTLTHRAGLAQNGVKQCEVAFRHGVKYGQALEREEANAQTVRLSTPPVPIRVRGRATVPEHPAIDDITLPGQRPLP